MIKKGYTVLMSSPINKQKIFAANSLLTYLDHSKKNLEDAYKYLDTIAIPFSNSKESGNKITTDELLKDRASLRKFRDEAIKKFNKFKEYAAYSYNLFQIFSSDPQMLGLMKSLSNSIDTLEKKVNNFSKLFDNLDSADFIENILKIIGSTKPGEKTGDSIKKDCDVIEILIEERIQEHIAKHIIGKNWIDDVSGKINFINTKKVPLIKELHQKQFGE